MKYDKMILLAKFKLSNLKFLTSKELVDSYISHDKFFSVSVSCVKRI